MDAFALHWYFLAVPISFSIIIAVVTLILYRSSHNSNGLGPEDSTMLGWKFIPTLIAVVYTQLVAMIFNAVKRTEPFVRLVKPIGRIPIARYTLLEKSNP